jgi:hypothetical protein
MIWLQAEEEKELAKSKPTKPLKGEEVIQAHLHVNFWYMES